MRKIILDTNILILHWHQSRAGRIADNTVEEAEGWARRLIAIHQSRWMVTPVLLEFLGIIVNGHEMKLSRAFIDHFHPLDDGNITGQDWQKARQLAERIGKGPSPPRRGAIDCLIKAIALRLDCEIRTADQKMPR